MIRLSLKKEPYWLEIVAGSRIKVRPLSMAIYQAARGRAWSDAEKEMGVERGADGKLPPETDFMLFNGLYNGYFAQHLARYAALEWEGFVMPDGSGPAECTPDNASDAMLIPAVGAKFLADYTKSISVLVTEGNA